MQSHSWKVVMRNSPTWMTIMMMNNQVYSTYLLALLSPALSSTPHSSQSLPSSSPPSSQSHPPSKPSASTPAQWSCTLRPVTIHPFQSPVGPTVPIPDSPSKIFDLFFTPSLVQTSGQLWTRVTGICIYIKIATKIHKCLHYKKNLRHAKQVMGDEKFSKWTQITVEELRAFLGFAILMGINILPSIKD